MADTVKNPFTPTFGRIPFALAGRTELIDDVMGGLANQPGDPNRATLFYGPRGCGKTVLMRAIAREAAQLGWVCVNVTTEDGMLDKIVRLARANAQHLVARESKSTLTSLQVGPLAISREVLHEKDPWWMQLTLIIEELNEQGTGLLITIDEVNAGCGELKEFISTFQGYVSEERDVALLLAGLPAQVSELLLDKQVSFIRRAFHRPLKPIDTVDVEHSLLETIVNAGGAIDAEALALAARASQGYAYAIQLVGFYLWMYGGPEHRFGAADVEQAVDLMKDAMANSVIIPTLRELTPREVEYLDAMLPDEGSSQTSDIARRMGISMTNAANLRRRLIAFGAIREVRMGRVEFDIPLLRDFLLENARRY